MQAFGILSFRCNICGRPCKQPVAGLSREVASCLACGSTVRMRAMVHALSIALFGRSMALCDFPQDKSITGVGMSDWAGYAEPLAGKLNYQNTYYHKQPRLDITSISPDDSGSVDFILTTDVFEHVCQPVSRAFENSLEMLKPNGALVISVPYSVAGETLEHFPLMHDFRIEDRGGNRVLTNTTTTGVVEEFSDLVFHGGEGDTLEMRMFSLAGLLGDLYAAGFKEVQVVDAPCFDFGIWHDPADSLPIIARREPALARIRNYGPRVIEPRASRPAGLPPDAVWVQLAGNSLAAPVELWIGDVAALSVGATPGLVTGVIPDAVLDHPGNYPILIRAANTAHPIWAGTIYVC